MHQPFVGSAKLLNRKSPRAPMHLRAVPRRTRVLGNWELVELIYTSATSRIYAGRPRRPESSPSGCDYAIKELIATDELSKLRFQREAALGRCLSHPNILPLLATQLADAPCYVVMPRIQGATLGRVIQEHGRFAIGKTMWIARQLVDALGCLHSQGWIHADVKPENILISYTGHVALFDFGLAVSTNEAASGDYDAFHGTLAFAAPELFSSKHRLSAASDVYSLGATLYKLVTGHAPFKYDRPEQLAQAHLQSLAPSARTYIPHLPSSIARLLERMLAKDPGRRPTTDGELQEELLRLEVDAFSLRDGLANDAA